MDENTIRIIAEKLFSEFAIGNWSRFCDEVDFDAASTDEVMTVIRDAIATAPVPDAGQDG